MWFDNPPESDTYPLDIARRLYHEYEGRAERVERIMELAYNQEIFPFTDPATIV
jgi:hypothetical protein